MKQNIVRAGLALAIMSLVAACATPIPTAPKPAPAPSAEPQTPAEPAPAAPIIEEALPGPTETQPNARLIGEYATRIRLMISRHIAPRKLKGNPTAEFVVSVLPGGKVDKIKLKRSSGNAAYDKAVARAIGLASPLPVPTEPSLFEAFKTLELKFRPN